MIERYCDWRIEIKIYVILEDIIENEFICIYIYFVYFWNIGLDKKYNI